MLDECGGELALLGKHRLERHEVSVGLVAVMAQVRCQRLDGGGHVRAHGQAVLGQEGTERVHPARGVAQQLAVLDDEDRETLDRGHRLLDVAPPQRQRERQREVVAVLEGARHLERVAQHQHGDRGRLEHPCATGAA